MDDKRTILTELNFSLVIKYNKKCTNKINWLLDLCPTVVLVILLTIIRFLFLMDLLNSYVCFVHRYSHLNLNSNDQSEYTHIDEEVLYTCAGSLPMSMEQPPKYDEIYPCQSSSVVFTEDQLEIIEVRFVVIEC
ncbi:hypothetical protein RF11_04074 [Thelohanellus kitauei]|uniref:Uncharacterized protein n=1 Tax=Thelohanellus kitauei TaxID=669202 RepID=A0A0C2J8F5_THEKT|nr:hypothetical protein RF11_04074 [Thelohanellus kitauei]